jgi:spore coat polysaccharide biosynthesis protein SpsF (cytidylyltransferase family)
MIKAIFITVRSGSSRLPNKCLLEINRMPVIQHLIRRVKRSKLKDKIILCTTKLKADDTLCRIAKRQGIDYFRGPVEDKLMRWQDAAKKFKVEFFVTADGDDLFCEPELIDLAFAQYKRSHPDFIEAKNLVCGAFTYGIKAQALYKVCKIKGSDETEMMSVYFTQTGLFKIEKLSGVPRIFKRPELRMTLDYQDDFKFFSAVIRHFIVRKKENFTLRDAILYLDKHPEVVKINQYLQKKFLANQKAKTKLILKKGAA